MITLRNITYENFIECINLEPKEEQKRFVARNIYSLAEAYIALSNKYCVPMPYAIYHDETMVGFIMLSYEPADEEDEEDETVYKIWRLMIDKKYQGLGYGRIAMEKALELIQTFPYGKAELVVLSYEPENEAARQLYASFGFLETGEMIDDEVWAVLRISEMNK
ncbi:MAG: GNAT family N-acetyltransferase [Caldicoprobacterales bacterium]|jgi:diamine N-acetyltransferase|nr:GNAT family N-acetyltransferase [Clostridiales bacterium]